MGAAAGHIFHLYENLELSFTDIINIKKGVIAGSVPSFEKFDGQNLMVTVKNGIISGARNKTQLKDPIPISYIPDMFLKYPHVNESFIEATGKIISALNELKNITSLDSIFCNGLNFLNLEIINQLSKNVITYNDSIIVMNGICKVHEGNILYTDPLETISLYDKFKAVFSKYNIFPVQPISIKSYPDFNIMGYKKLLSANNIKDLNTPLKTFSDKSDLIKNIILKMGHEMILDINSSFANKTETHNDIRNRLKNILTSAAPDQLIKINPHLQKIQFCGGLKYLPSIEGVVFYYNNIPYKITGIFAPINQILGIFKYSR